MRLQGSGMFILVYIQTKQTWCLLWMIPFRSWLVRRRDVPPSPQPLRYCIKKTINSSSFECQSFSYFLLETVDATQGRHVSRKSLPIRIQASLSLGRGSSTPGVKKQDHNVDLSGFGFVCFFFFFLGSRRASQAVAESDGGLKPQWLFPTVPYIS